ncbi:MAG: CCC motif membrane protein [Chitinophagaceae bacterium]
MEEKSIFDQPQQPYNMQQSLPNATVVLVLGILSIVICFLGVAMGIIALVLAGKDSKLYNTSPEIYSAVSYNNLKAGKTCAIIGLILNGLLALLYIAIFIFALSGAASAWR